MKSTGIVRKVDELGRIVLPIELRRTLDIVEKDAIEIYVDGASIILKKYEPTCVFCGDAKNITVYKGKNVCANCIKELKKTHGMKCHELYLSHRERGLPVQFQPQERAGSNDMIIRGIFIKILQCSNAIRSLLNFIKKNQCLARYAVLMGGGSYGRNYPCHVKVRFK